MNCKTLVILNGEARGFDTPNTVPDFNTIDTLTKMFSGKIDLLWLLSSDKLVSSDKTQKFVNSNGDLLNCTYTASKDQIKENVTNFTKPYANTCQNLYKWRAANSLRYGKDLFDALDFGLEGMYSVFVLTRPDANIHYISETSIKFKDVNDAIIYCNKSSNNSEVIDDDSAAHLSIPLMNCETVIMTRNAAIAFQSLLKELTVKDGKDKLITSPRYHIGERFWAIIIYLLEMYYGVTVITRTHLHAHEYLNFNFYTTIR